MPRLADLVRENEPAKLLHPIVGEVDWDDKDRNGHGFILTFAKGREKDRPLVVDVAVLLDETWTIRK